MSRFSELPRFTCLPEPGEHHQSGIIIAPTLDYMDEAFLDAKRDGWSKKPIVEMLIPSTVDDSLAPPGQHVASLFCQQFAPELPDGRSWDDEREAAADCIIDTVEAHAPGFKASVIARQIHSPLDLERKFGLIGGDIMHGNMSARPAVVRAPGAGPRHLSRADQGALHVRRGHPSRRRRHRRAGAQCRPRHPEGPHPAGKPAGLRLDRRREGTGEKAGTRTWRARRRFSGGQIFIGHYLTPNPVGGTAERPHSTHCSRSRTFPF